MKNEPNIRVDGTIDRAIRALGELPIPPGPPPETIQAVLAAGMSQPKGAQVQKGIFTMNRFSKIAAVILIVAGITALVIFLTVGRGGATIAWADVQQHIRNARTMTFKATVEVEGLPNMEMTQMFKEPGLMRHEMTMGPAKTIAIMDIQQSKMIVLMEAQKKAIIIDLTDLREEIRKKHEEQNFLAGIKKLIEESETELGEKEINGRAVKGYRVEKGNQVFTIWADAETGQPVEVNMTMFRGESEMTMSDFEFDVELDESLFSLDIPEGYTVEQKQLDIKEASIEDLVEMLRIWTKIRGGTFPDAITPSHLIKDSKDGKFEDQGLAKDNSLEIAAGMTRAWMLLAQHGEAHYAGKGVKLGDGETAIFWYRPKDSQTYKVIYGDLRIEDVAEENLPSNQPALETDETSPAK